MGRAIVAMHSGGLLIHSLHTGFPIKVAVVISGVSPTKWGATANPVLQKKKKKNARLATWIKYWKIKMTTSINVLLQVMQTPPRNRENGSLKQHWHETERKNKRNIVCVRCALHSLRPRRRHAPHRNYDIKHPVWHPPRPLCVRDGDNVDRYSVTGAFKNHYVNVSFISNYFEVYCTINS